MRHKAFDAQGQDPALNPNAVVEIWTHNGVVMRLPLQCNAASIRAAFLEEGEDIPLGVIIAELARNGRGADGLPIGTTPGNDKPISTQ